VVETKVSKLGKRLIKAARETRTIARGEADPRTYQVHVPAEIDVQRGRATPSGSTSPT
jgi:putative transcriptional regulator